jgi:hypothetical protein
MASYTRIRKSSSTLNSHTATTQETTQVLWHVIFCRWLRRYGRFERFKCLQLQLPSGHKKLLALLIVWRLNVWSHSTKDAKSHSKIKSATPDLSKIKQSAQEFHNITLNCLRLVTTHIPLRWVKWLRSVERLIARHRERSFRIDR